MTSPRQFIIFHYGKYKYIPNKSCIRLTGLSIHVIRAWEKRYNVVVPERTDTNRRLYSHSDIEKLKLLSNASEKGYAIGSFSSLSIDDLRNIIIGEENEEIILQKN